MKVQLLGGPLDGEERDVKEPLPLLQFAVSTGNWAEVPLWEMDEVVDTPMFKLLTYAWTARNRYSYLP